MKSLTLNAVITSITAKTDGSLGLRVGTPELPPSYKAEFMELQNINVLMTIKPMDIPDVPEVKIDADLEQKTQSQRLRGVLYVLFEQNNEGHTEFETYYKSKMNGIIEHLKEKIE